MASETTAERAAASRIDQRSPVPRRIPIAILLGLCLGALVLLAAASVLVISIWSGVQTTLDVVEDQAILAIDMVEQSLDDHLAPAEHQMGFINDMIVAGRLDPADDQRLEDVLTGALAATPQVDGIVFLDPALRMRGVVRSGGGAFWIDEDHAGDPNFQAFADDAARNPSLLWGDLVWSPTLDTTVQSIRRPVFVGGAFVGALGAGVSPVKLSRFVKQFETDDGAQIFILHGHTQVLAHPALADGIDGLSATRLTPTIDEVGDLVLAAIWENPEQADAFESDAFEAHRITLDGDEWVFIYRWVDRYGPEPWLVGAYFPGSTVEAQFARLQWAAAAGLGVLVLGVVAAFFIGRRIADPVRRLAHSAQRIGAFEFHDVETLARSRMRELDEAAGAFNLMLGGLRWFESYVPRKLVHRLMGETEGALASEEREVTVMFTDIAGFTTLAEGLPPAETAAFLNHHFALVTACVEAEGGTVDKYIGDAVMAFWGAPERQPDHARRACRAARAIAAVITADNAERARRGQSPVRLRIGIHTGLAVIGNIGAPDRINYTIIGDTVNICQRIEQAGKELGASDGDAVVHVSAETRERLDGSFATTSVGSHALKGRSAKIDIFRLEVP